MASPRTFALRNATAAIRSVASKKHTSTRRLMSTMHDNDPETLELEKQRNLSNEQHKTSTPHSNAPGWNEHLASASEASVKADKSGPDSPAELQAQTVEYIRSRYSPDDRMGPTTACYPRDEVSGPLGTALGHEDTREVHKKTVVKEVRTTKVTEESSGV